MHIHIANSSERIPRDGGERHQEGSPSLSAGDETEQLLGGAGLAEEDENVAGGESADVAVKRVERGEEGGAEAEGDEGLGDFVGDEGGFADAGEEDGAGGGEEEAGEGEGLGEVEVFEEVVEEVLLGFEEGQEVVFRDVLVR